MRANKHPLEVIGKHTPLISELQKTTPLLVLLACDGDGLSEARIPALPVVSSTACGASALQEMPRDESSQASLAARGAQTSSDWGRIGHR